MEICRDELIDMKPVPLSAFWLPKRMLKISHKVERIKKAIYDLAEQQDPMRLREG